MKKGDKAANVHLVTVRHVFGGIFWKEWNLESGMEKSFKYSPVKVFLFYLSKIISHLQYFFHLSLLIIEY